MSASVPCPSTGGAAPRAGASGSAAYPVPVLHVISSEEIAAAPGFLKHVDRMLECAGPDVAVHLRLPSLPAERLFELGRRVARMAEAGGGWCVVNGRVDVALACGAQAAQIGASTLPLGEAIALAAGRVSIGASVHGVREAARAARAGANYVLLGTIYASSTHPGRRGRGPALVEACREALGRLEGCRPSVIAIGGIDRVRAARLRKAGADGIAVRGAVWRAPDPAEAAGALLAGFRGDIS
ncbi:MAG: thiamine phosphate synthase [Gemmatimonadota bacterium]